MTNNKSWLWWGIGSIVILAGLFAWPKINNPDKETIARWEGYGVECLTGGHVNPAQHIHPHLEIYIDGQRQTIPADIGVVKSCMAEMHTHDDTGKIHIESAYAGKEFSLRQFFDVWKEKIEKGGYDLEMTVDDTPSVEFGNLPLKDNQKIVLKYTKK